MFLTITIDTTKQKKKKAVRMNRKKFSPVDGWKQSANRKKRSFWKKFISWNRKVKNGVYKFGEQVAMF